MKKPSKAIGKLPFFFFFLLGCGDARPETPAISEAPSESETTSFNPATAADIRGQVLWSGDIPQIAPIEVLPNPLSVEPFLRKQVRENPNAPEIDPRSKAVRNAVVFLRGVDPRQARPWDQPSVRVEQSSSRLHVLQGEADARSGFVRRGDKIRMVSREPIFHVLRARGAAFFSLAFPDPEQPLERVLHEKGIVELSSAAGCFWLRAYLFVDDHPYYTRTDAQGRFVLPHVPPGRYEVVCWMPNWIKVGHERDPESSFIKNITFGKALERTAPVTVEKNKSEEVLFRVSHAAGE